MALKKPPYSSITLLAFASIDSGTVLQGIFTLGVV